MKGVQVVQMYTAADTDAAASIDIPDDGELLGVQMFARADIPGAADNESVSYELSFGSTSSLTANDARQVIAGMMVSSNLNGVAANTLRNDVHKAVDFQGGIDVFAGERIYIHVAVTAGADNLAFRAHLLFKFKGAGAVGRRR